MSSIRTIVADVLVVAVAALSGSRRCHASTSVLRAYNAPCASTRISAKSASATLLMLTASHISRGVWGESAQQLEPRPSETACAPNNDSTRILFRIHEHSGIRRRQDDRATFGCQPKL